MEKSNGKPANRDAAPIPSLCLDDKGNNHIVWIPGISTALCGLAMGKDPELADYGTEDVCAWCAFAVLIHRIEQEED